MEKRKKMREVEVGVWCDGGDRYSSLSGEGMCDVV